jgi:hypothetical protein
MKTRVITIMILFFISFWSVGVAGNDDCPCRKKRPLVNKHAVSKTKTTGTTKSSATLDKKWDRYVLYPKGYYDLPSGVDYSYGKMKEIENFKVRIMPYPVSTILNVIYNTEQRGTVTIELLTSEGKLVQTLLQKMEPGGQTVHSFDIAGKVRPGIAYLRFTSGKIVKVEELFIL